MSVRHAIGVQPGRNSAVYCADRLSELPEYASPYAPVALHSTLNSLPPISKR
jgi:hypothetical protein